MLPTLRDMWKTCFGDSDEYLDIFFRYKYQDNNTLVYIAEGETVASLYMLPYTITFYGQKVPFTYLMGLCTLPEHRNKGYMGKLIWEAHRIINERQIALSILIPAEKRLFDYYNKFGYEQVFDKGNELIPLRKILDENRNIDKAYHIFDAMYKDKDFCVQKSKVDFEAITLEYKSDGYPPKYNLCGMANITDIWSLLKLYAKANPHIKLNLEVEGDTTYLICDGWVEAVDGLMADMKVDSHLLCRLLFGYHTNKLKDYNILFPERNPIMNLMLE